MGNAKLGRVVWHDLFTADLERARTFYQGLAGWRYVSEHAEDFTWGGGARDYVLALLSEEAGAGLIARSIDSPFGWVPYVEAESVDRTAELAPRLGGKIVKPPVDVEGVGRNCLLEDPCGAVFGVSVSRHGFPRPTKQFGPEVYLAGADGFPDDFYRDLLGWRLERGDRSPGRARIVCAAGDIVAEIGVSAQDAGDRTASWVPSLRVAVKRPLAPWAASFSGRILDPSITTGFVKSAVLVSDPGGAISVIFQGTA